MSVSGEAAELWLVWLDDCADALLALEASDPLAPAGELDDLDGARRIARLALRRLLLQFFGRVVAEQPLTAGPHGKPAIAGLCGDFNLSHTTCERRGREKASVALIGLGRVAAIGVDVEPLRAVRLDERRRALIQQAGCAVAGGVPLAGCGEAQMIQAWARLEAWGKATGLGIGRTLSHFGIWGHSGLHAGTAQVDDAAHRGLTVHDVHFADGLFAAVALPHGIAPPPVRVLPAAAEASQTMFKDVAAKRGEFRR